MGLILRSYREKVFHVGRYALRGLADRGGSSDNASTGDEVWEFQARGVEMDARRRKEMGAYYTPDEVASSLVSWVVRSPFDRLIDPACGDGRFLRRHRHGVGVEADPIAAAKIHEHSPGSLIHQGNFFEWAADTQERFECAAGNPPFIRYQRFTGATRESALRLCERNGARFNSLSSSWAPFLVATASLLKRGGGMAFVTPAEIGHAPYATPLLDYLTRNFRKVQIVAVEEKIFPDLSEDCWLLYCEGFGECSHSIFLTKMRRFEFLRCPPRPDRRVAVADLARWGGRLRPFLLDDAALAQYEVLAMSDSTARLSQFARVGIGYVTGANNFFHLRPSVAARLGIPDRFLVPAIRNGKDLRGDSISNETIRQWRRDDEPNFLLRLRNTDVLPDPVLEYLESSEGKLAKEAYKCRHRRPWYAVPDVQVPDGFLSYMCGESPSIVANRATCVAANSVHVVRMKPGETIDLIQRRWSDPLTQLSCELEGHPLGGGMLKLEPREAGRVLIRRENAHDRKETTLLLDAAIQMRRWRHYG